MYKNYKKKNKGQILQHTQEREHHKVIGSTFILINARMHFPLEIIYFN